MLFFISISSPPLFFLWPSPDHIWSCRQITHTHTHRARKEKYPRLNILYSPPLLLSISPSLHLAVSNTSCRARSWLIRALVANTSSPSPAAEMNGDQMRSSYEVGCWVIGDTSGRGRGERRRGRDENEEEADETRWMSTLGFIRT